MGMNRDPRRSGLWHQVIDARTEYQLRMAYLNGWISIDVYLDRKFGTSFASAGGLHRAG